VDREGEDRVTRELDGLLNEREEEKLLGVDTRPGEYDLELEEDLILVDDVLDEYLWEGAVLTLERDCGEYRLSEEE